MPQISHIKHSDIKLAHRFDAEYFKPELLRIEKMISKINTLPLSDFVASGYRVVYENTKILSDEEIIGKKVVNFLQASDILNYSLNYDLKKVSYSDWVRYPKGRIQHGEILIEVKGNIDKVAYVPNDFPANTIVSGSLYKLTVNNKITPELLLIWLTCKYGDYLKSKLKRNVTIYFLGKDDLYGIPVPIFHDNLKDSITDIVKIAFKKQSDSKSLYDEAEKLLLGELRLLEYQLENTLTFSTTCGAVRDAGRYDSEYFQPKYDAIIKIIEGYAGGYDLLKNQFQIINGKTPEFYSEDVNEVQILKTKQIRTEALIFEELAYSKKEYVSKLVKEGDVIFASMGVGSLGRTGIYYQSENGKPTGIDGTLKIFRRNSIVEPEVLQVFLNSKEGQTYLYKYVVGSTGIISIRNESVENLKIPLIKPAIQTQIAEKIQESHRLRSESRELLERAKKMVEEEIEKSA